MRLWKRWETFRSFVMLPWSGLNLSSLGGSSFCQIYFHGYIPKWRRQPWISSNSYERNKISLHESYGWSCVWQWIQNSTKHRSRVSKYVDTTREVSVKLAMNVISIIQKRIVKDTWLEATAMRHVQKDIPRQICKFWQK